jgi:16S rRNA (guanine1516-N2)-methyltransferase
MSKISTQKILNNIALGYLDSVDSEYARHYAKKWQFDYLGDVAAAKKAAAAEILITNASPRPRTLPIRPT